MLIFSWNVAGWKTTVHKIHENYGNEVMEECVPAESRATCNSTSDSSSTDNSNDEKKPCATAATTTAAATTTTNNNNKKKKSKAMNPLSYFLQRHGDVDILCLQEHKIPKQQLISRTEAKQSSHIPGYESFWSCCTDDKKKGLNGVVTYCKKGLVQSANASPLLPAELNQQGRCVLTDHGTFCVFNVYVPASGGQPLSYKMKFLQALQRAMRHERQVNNKAVILVGDLNISHKAEDVYWKDRAVHVQDVLDEVAARASAASQTCSSSSSNTSNNNDIDQWKQEVAHHWPMIERVMATKTAVPTKTTNSLTKETYNKYRLQVTDSSNKNQRKIFLGKCETTHEYCLHCYDFDARTYTNDDTDEVLLAREANVVTVETLSELMSRIANLPHWSSSSSSSSSDAKSNSVPLSGEALQRHIANTYAREPRVSPTRTWLSNLLKDDDMVDVFRHFYPTAQGRFTCWHQFTNQRYSNRGYRLDYTIVDRSLLCHCLQGPATVPTTTLRCCRRQSMKTKSESAVTATAASSREAIAPKSKEDEVQEDPLGEMAALRATTANGRFQPASFEGNGIDEASREALDTQFWGCPHTGMVYSPPTFSDHIAVSLLMSNKVVPPVPLTLNDNKDAATRKAQPHKVQKSIASFFSTDGTSATKPAASKTTASNFGNKKALAKTKIGVNGVPTTTKKSFFTTKVSSSTSRSSSTTTILSSTTTTSTSSVLGTTTKKSAVRTASTQKGNSSKRPKKATKSSSSSKNNNNNNNQSSILSHFQKQQDK